MSHKHLPQNRASNITISSKTLQFSLILIIALAIVIPLSFFIGVYLSGNTIFQNHNQNAGYTNILYVHKDGDNSNGLTWETGYNTVKTALDSASSDLNDITLIIIAPGLYDLNIEGIYIVNKNVEIASVSPNLVTIKNNHPSATGVLQFNKFGGILNIHVACGTSNTNGLIYNGEGSIDSLLSHVVITSNKESGECKMISLQNGACQIASEDLHLIGNHNAIGLCLDKAHDNTFRNLYINNCSDGIQLNDEIDDYNIFESLSIINSITGIRINAGNQQTFRAVSFLDNDDNINDTIGDSIYTEIKLNDPYSFVTPDDLIGALVLGGSASYGDDTELWSVESASDPFVIVAIIFSFNVSENCGIRLSTDNGTTYFFETVLETWTSDEVHSFQLDMNYPQIFNKGTRISCSIRTESGDDSANIWLQIKEI